MGKRRKAKSIKHTKSKKVQIPNWKRIFFKYIETDNVSPKEKEIFRRKSPSSFYKYQSIGDYTYDNIVNDKMFFSNILEFNDPFDGEFHVNYDFLDMMDSGKGTFNKGFREKVENVFRNNLIVSCFSETYDNLLMWGYYTDNHTGICVEYDIGEASEVSEGYLKSTEGGELEEGLYFGPVCYKREFPNIQEPNKEGSRKISAAAYTKNEDWAHEKEWRVIVNNGLAFFNKNSDDYNNSQKYIEPRAGEVMDWSPAKAIYIGVRTKENNIKQILDIAKKKAIKVYKMKKSKTEYKLIAEEIYNPNNNTV